MTGFDHRHSTEGNYPIWPRDKAHNSYTYLRKSVPSYVVLSYTKSEVIDGPLKSFL